MKDKEFIKNWIATHKYCVIATSLEEKPWAATVNYTSDEDMNIYISTHPTSLKFKNVLQNPTVCLVIDSQTRDGTLQIQGKVKIIKGKPFKEPNLMIKPEFLIFKKKNEDTGELKVVRVKI